MGGSQPPGYSARSSGLSNVSTGLLHALMLRSLMDYRKQQKASAIALEQERLEKTREMARAESDRIFGQEAAGVFGHKITEADEPYVAEARGERRQLRPPTIVASPTPSGARVSLSPSQEASQRALLRGAERAKGEASQEAVAQGADQGTLSYLATSPGVHTPAEIPGIIKGRAERRFETAKAGVEEATLGRQPLVTEETQAKIAKEKATTTEAEARTGEIKERIPLVKAQVEEAKLKAEKERMGIAREKEADQYRALITDPNVSPQDKEAAFRNLAVIRGHEVDLTKMDRTTVQDYVHNEEAIGKMRMDFATKGNDRPDLAQRINVLSTRNAIIGGAPNTTVIVHPKEEGTLFGTAMRGPEDRNVPTPLAEGYVTGRLLHIIRTGRPNYIDSRQTAMADAPRALAALAEIEVGPDRQAQINAITNEASLPDVLKQTAIQYIQAKMPKPAEKPKATPTGPVEPFEERVKRGTTVPSFIREKLKPGPGAEEPESVSSTGL